MKLCVFFDNSVKDGGAFHQSLKTIKILNKLDKNLCELVFLTVHKETHLFLLKENYNSIYYKPNILDRFFFFTYNSYFMKSILKKFKIHNRFENFIKKEKIDLIYFLTIARYSLFCDNINFISYIYEIHHLLRPDLPEYKGWHDFSFRELLTINTIKKASKIFVDTNIKKEELIKYYNCYDKKIEVIPYIPNLTDFDKDSIPIDNKRLEEFISSKKKYYFYPAQYWPIKNHKYIIDSLKFFKKYKSDINFVFTGQKKLNYDYLKELSIKDNVSEYVKFFDYLSNNDIINLYKNAQALVFPCIVGRSSLPLYEAFYFKLPVFYNKDLLDKELVEFVTEFDVLNPENLAEVIMNTSESELNKKKDLGYNYFQTNINSNKIQKKYENILEEYIYSSSMYKFRNKN